MLGFYDESEGKVAKRNLDPTTLGDRDASGAGNSLKTLRPVKLPLFFSQAVVLPEKILGQYG